MSTFNSVLFFKQLKMNCSVTVQINAVALHPYVPDIFYSTKQKLMWWIFSTKQMSDAYIIFQIP